MLPLLKLASDGREHRVRDAIERLASDFGINDAERAELLPSGTAPLLDNRLGWARSYLKQAGLLQSPKRGAFQITEAGKALLAENPSRIDSGCSIATSLFARFDAAVVTPRRAKRKSIYRLLRHHQRRGDSQPREHRQVLHGLQRQQRDAGFEGVA